MTDLVVGLGEIGKPIMKLLQQRNFDVQGHDIKNPIALDTHYEMIHICIPYSEKFVEQIEVYKQLVKHDNRIIIHSTVEAGTSKKLHSVYSPIRGVHNEMFEALKWFTKYYAWHEDLIEFEKRFPKCIRVSSSTKLETSKLVSTSRYGVDMKINEYFENEHPHYKEFMFELNQRYGILPTYYNEKKEVGGHCIIPNLDLLGDDFIKSIFMEKNE